MKNLKSLQLVGLAGVAIALTSGCSSTGMSQNSSSDEHAAYRFASSAGWAPITDVRQLNSFPQSSYWQPGDFGPVSYESYTFAVPTAAPATVASSDVPQFNANLKPGETYVEAAGADAGSESGQVRRVIRYSPFGSTGLGH